MSYLVFEVLSDQLECDITFAAAAASLVQASSVASPFRRWLSRVRIARKAIKKWKQAGARCRLRDMCVLFVASWHGAYDVYNEQHAAFLKQWSTGEFKLVWNNNCSACHFLDGLKTVLVLGKSSGDPDAISSIVHQILLIIETTGSWVCRDFDVYMAWVPSLQKEYITEDLFEVDVHNTLLEAQACGPESGGGLYQMDFLDMVHLCDDDVTLDLPPELAATVLRIITQLPYPAQYALLVRGHRSFSLMPTTQPNSTQDRERTLFQPNSTQDRERTLFAEGLQLQDLVSRTKQVLGWRNL